MRRAILELVFVGLSANEAHSSAFASNARSIAVSRRLGYEDNGEEMALRGGTVPERAICFRISKQRYLESRRDDITIEGLEPCLELFGLGDTTDRPLPSA
jgi:RimJ/RimL family protein N-acetyltransferase